MKKRAILAIVALWTLVAVPLAVGAPVEGWNQRLGEAVNNVSMAADAIKALPESARADFAAAVLAALAAKQGIGDEYGKAAAGLLAGAGGARGAVLAAIVEGVAKGGSAAKMALLAGSVASQLSATDRVAFAGGVLRAVGRQTDADGHKVTLCAVALTLADRSGESRKGVIAEVFALVNTNDLAAVAAAFSKGFGQERNGMSDEQYLQVATQVLRAVAERLAGQADAANRFAFAVAALLNGARNPDAFRDALAAGIGGLLDQMKSSPSDLAGRLAEARSGLAANETLARSLFPAGGVQRLPGINALWMLFGQDMLTFVGQNRPPRGIEGYQNQSVGGRR